MPFFIQDDAVQALLQFLAMALYWKWVMLFHT